MNENKSNIIKPLSDWNTGAKTVANTQCDILH